MESLLDLGGKAEASVEAKAGGRLAVTFVHDVNRSIDAIQWWIARRDLVWNNRHGQRMEDHKHLLSCLYACNSSGEIIK